MHMDVLRALAVPERAPGAHILVIDDQETTRYVFRRSLLNAGYTVEEAGNGTDGLEKATLAPDLIIADVNLPDMLGYDVCRRLKANPLTASIPVLQVSASFVSDESKVQALEGGADSYLIQPVDPTVLVAQVQALLRLRKAEALSSLSARQWQSTFDGLSDGLALADSDGTIVRVNRAFATLLRMVPSDAEGKPLEEVFQAKFHVALPQFLEQRDSDSGNEVVFDSQWFRVRYELIQPDPLRAGGSILLLTDITDHKKLRETLRMSERLAATGRLAHTIAHEINNPLEAMTNLLYIVERDPSLSETTHSYVQQASVELERISQITKQILAFHRDSRRPIPTKVDDMLDGVLAMFRAPILSNRIEIKKRYRCSRPVCVHPGEMRQAFGNLISNAVDAMATQGGTLTVHCFNGIDRDDISGVHIVFCDSGPGIPSAAQARIFDAFYTTKELKGSGLGLWLTAEVVAKHQGHIRVRSRTEGPHRGTIFDVFLPEYLPHREMST
ncbi:MAG: response regulator [Acidobacteriaceae bacterium]